MRLALLLLLLRVGVAILPPLPFVPVFAKPSSLVDLRPGEELKIRHHSYSCFHVAICDLTFRRDSVLTVNVVLVRSGPAGVREPRQLATLTVTDSTAVELDDLLRIHRQAPPRRSNGGVRLELTQTRDGAVVAEELLDKNPVIRRLGSHGFDALIAMARRAAPASAFSGEYR